MSEDSGNADAYVSCWWKSWMRRCRAPTSLKQQKVHTENTNEFDMAVEQAKRRNTISWPPLATQLAQEVWIQYKFGIWIDEDISNLIRTNHHTTYLEHLITPMIEEIQLQGPERPKRAEGVEPRLLQGLLPWLLQAASLPSLPVSMFSLNIVNLTLLTTGQVTWLVKRIITFIHFSLQTIWPSTQFWQVVGRRHGWRCFMSVDIILFPHTWWIIEKKNSIDVYWKPTEAEEGFTPHLSQSFLQH